MNEIFAAINRFCYESLNFGVISYVWKNSWNKGRPIVFVPRFLTEVKWTCDTDHLVEKWVNLQNRGGSNEENFIHFYVLLGTAGVYP
jgi:hypothetical protein